MGCFATVAFVLMMTISTENVILCDGSPSPGMDGDASDASIPILASGKRQHNIMRFGKRPAGGHSLIHFGKRDEVAPSKPQHSFLYFGKRDMDVPDLFDYLQKNRDGSYKRGHTIMRFGKRAPADSHNFIRFGRQLGDGEEDEKRGSNGHSMLYFGKRNNGHSMLYFGKRGNGHSMMYFGKRDQDREQDSYPESDYEKRAHAMIHFGKREEGDPEEKRAHAMIHFGKRDEESEGGPKRGSHAMIHFGKRVPEDDEDDYETNWSPDLLEAKRQHNLLRFGKRRDRKESHAMIHFGKRSVDVVAAAGNQSEKGIHNRVKREADQHSPLVTLVGYDNNNNNQEDIDDEVPAAVETLKGNIQTSPAFFRPNDIWSPTDEEWEPSYYEYSLPDKRDGGKNVFLRFG